MNEFVSKIFGVIKNISVNSFSAIQMSYLGKNESLLKKRRYSVLINQPILNFGSMRML